MTANDPVVVVASIVPKPDRREAVRDALLAAVQRVHAEDEGCLLYALHESEQELVLIEKWSSADTLAVHSKGAAFQELGGKLDGSLQEPLRVTRLKPVPAGSAEQGEL